MFQTWLESSRRFRTLQTPARWLSSSNKEQVRRSDCFYPRNASIAILTFHQQRLLEHHIFLSAGPPVNPDFFSSHFCCTQACNVLYLNSVETESLTGPEAVCKATKCTLALSPRPAATVVHFKVSAQGITLTDSKRR